MTGHWELALIAVRVLLLGVGLATTAISFRAYQQQQTRYLRDATLGFGFITLGVLIEGFL
jgi:CHASE1-domain containing sensor protein